MLDQIRIVLVETTHPGNIGGAARAMLNMEIERLYLVNPERFPSQEAIGRASGANRVLDNAVIADNLSDALKGCSLVIGTSARTRALAIPLINPRECAKVATQHSQSSEVAIVFGREYAGLTNEELQRCHYHVQIPCNPNFSSLNLAAAVQVICYELFVATKNVIQTVAISNTVATDDEMQGFYDHLEQVLIETEFHDPNVPKQLMARLRRLYNRAQPDQTEMNILRGILTSFQKKLTRGKSVE